MGCASMQLTVWLTDFTFLDGVAIAALFIAWFGMNWWIEKGPHAEQTLSAIMHRKRLEWMRQAAARDQRIFDASLLITLQNGTSFFASATLLAAGGAVALIAETDQVARVAQDLPLPEITTNPAVYETKLLLVLLLVGTGFLKFALAQRLFSYAGILMGAIPNRLANNPERDAACEKSGAQAAALLVQGGVSFNRGLRTLYFTLAALAWLIGPIASLLATLAIARMIWEREFNSKSRAALL